MNLASLRRDRDLRDIAADLGKAVDEIDEVVRKNEEKLHGSDLHALTTRQDQHAMIRGCFNTTPLENSREVPPRCHDEVLRRRAARLSPITRRGSPTLRRVIAGKPKRVFLAAVAIPMQLASTTPSYSARAFRGSGIRLAWTLSVTSSLRRWRRASLPKVAPDMNRADEEPRTWPTAPSIRRNGRPQKGPRMSQAPVSGDDPSPTSGQLMKLRRSSTLPLAPFAASSTRVNCQRTA